MKAAEQAQEPGRGVPPLWHIRLQARVVVAEPGQPFAATHDWHCAEGVTYRVAVCTPLLPQGAVQALYAPNGPQQEVEQILWQG